MRVAIEATATCRQIQSGVAKYTHNLIQALLEQAAHETGDEISLGYRLSRWKHRRYCAMPPGVKRFWFQEPIWPLFPGVQVVHGTDGRVPNWRGVARVATIHDLIPLQFPETSSARFRARIRKTLGQMAAASHKIIADSESTRRDFLQRFDYPPEHVEVVWLGVNDRFRPRPEQESGPVLASQGLSPGYLFYVGEISRRKNIANMLAAYAASRIVNERLLVLAGGISFGGEELLSSISALGIEHRVKLLGYVRDEELPSLYAGAGGFLFPTLYEGFGLPVLEAMASGVPVIAGHRGSVPEIAGGHATLVNPEDPRDISMGIESALAMTSEARESARAHAGSFTWRECARRTRTVYELALAMV